MSWTNSSTGTQSSAPREQFSPAMFSFTNFKSPLLLHQTSSQSTPSCCAEWTPTNTPSEITMFSLPPALEPMIEEPFAHKTPVVVPIPSVPQDPAFVSAVVEMNASGVIKPAKAHKRKTTPPPRPITPQKSLRLSGSTTQCEFCQRVHDNSYGSGGWCIPFPAHTCKQKRQILLRQLCAQFFNHVETSAQVGRG